MKRQEVRTIIIFQKPLDQVILRFLFPVCSQMAPILMSRFLDVILGAERNFSIYRATEANAKTMLPTDDADDVCNALFEAVTIPMNNLDGPCAQWTHISNDERNEPLATFQRLIQTALIGLFPKHCIVDLDDIPVFAGDIREHNANLKLVLGSLGDAGLTLNPKKCRFLQRSFTFLGHTVPLNGMAVTKTAHNK
ncbi:Retrovirus-related Pol polyprotein from transposon 297 [Echinococcus granulosus]|uniref:Retrovirus-related Pol polyprotein from transposon 297 n=1 Tax=Echinococcus granulosus TaxID=6210 RepID=W6UXQ3_ECHGR|nr:Retrovirus-related Pol polyprotein from transposon 297 [Echinococcus granulosus]EUB63347.1 Retrovirus-related Pol polyprotein from transposon 297 [Echinococcus granulosus]